VAALCEASERFLARWPSEPWALLVGGYAALYRGERSRALEHIEDALEREPSLLAARSLHGQLLAMDGQMAPAVSEIARVLRLSPRSPELWVYECVMALAYFAGGCYGDARSWAERAVSSSNGTGVMAYGVLASASAHLGDKDPARIAARAFKELAPRFSNERFRPMVASTKPEIAARYLEGLQRACSL
jgi:adenylate cyclase